MEDEDEGAVNTGSNLFVTGIHPRLTESDISRLFEKYGDVENCSIMVDPHTKESRGFGFVNMVSAEQADAAKEGLQGEVIEGRTLSIEKARRSKPRTPTPGKYFGPPKRGKFMLCIFHGPRLCLAPLQMVVVAVALLAVVIATTTAVVAWEATGAAATTTITALAVMTPTVTAVTMVVTTAVATTAPVTTVAVATTAATRVTTMDTVVVAVVFLIAMAIATAVTTAVKTAVVLVAVMMRPVATMIVMPTPQATMRLLPLASPVMPTPAVPLRVVARSGTVAGNVHPQKKPKDKSV